MAEISVRALARVGGFLYVIIMICGFFAEGYVRGSLIVSGDAVATSHNILSSEQFYRLGGTVEFLTLFCDIVVGFILYTLLVPVSTQSLSLLAVFFRLVFVSIFGVLSVTHFAPLLLLNGGLSLSAFSPAQLQQAALFALRLHTVGFLMKQTYSLVSTAY